MHNSPLKVIDVGHGTQCPHRTPTYRAEGGIGAYVIFSTGAKIAILVIGFPIAPK
jgi:hypothetical protein